MNAKLGYEPLAAVLSQALDQAQSGKGNERHAQGQAFEDQPMQKLIDLYGSGFALGQAAKKMQEAQRLPYERARAELLGAINYAAGAVIALDRAQMGCHADTANVCAVFDVTPRPADAPAWANGEGVAGIVKHPLWINGEQYAHKFEPSRVLQIGGSRCFNAKDIQRTSFFNDVVAHVSANDNARHG